jgi:hypothetical protein
MAVARHVSILLVPKLHPADPQVADHLLRRGDVCRGGGAGGRGRRAGESMGELCVVLKGRGGCTKLYAHLTDSLTMQS